MRAWAIFDASSAESEGELRAVAERYLQTLSDLLKEK